MNGSSRWRDRAKCLGQPLRLYLTNELPREEPERSLTAEQRCSGCPVLHSCGLDALEHGDRGVIRAAVPLGNDAKALYASQLRLRNNLGIPTSWPRNCTICNRSMRPPDLGQAAMFPNTIMASRHNLNECGSCVRARQRKEKNARTTGESEGRPEAAEAS